MEPPSMLGRSSYGSITPRWRVWPPRRALEIERGEEEPIAERISNLPPAITSEIDPQYPVFGNPLTATVRANFEAAKDEIEDLYRRIAALEMVPGLGRIDGGEFD